MTPMSRMKKKMVNCECTPKVLYTITMDKALQSGFALTLGGEAKLVVPIKHWNKEAK